MGFVETSKAWSDDSPNALGQGIPGQDLAVVNSLRTMNSQHTASGNALAVEVAHEVGHTLMPGGRGGAEADHNTGGLMGRNIEKAMINPVYTPSAIERLRAGSAGGFFK